MQAELHQIPIQPDLFEKADVVTLASWMSASIDELARDKNKFPDWLVGCLPEVR